MLVLKGVLLENAIEFGPATVKGINGVVPLTLFDLTSHRASRVSKLETASKKNIWTYVTWINKGL